jgi:AcrR family transcriptional regulator
MEYEMKQAVEALEDAEVVEEEKRDRLYRAAEPLFERYGYRKTTVEEICRSAGMSKRTFYELFDDKADLFIGMVTLDMNRMTAEWEMEQADSGDPVERLVSLLDLYAEMVRSHPGWRVMFEDVELLRIFSRHIDEMRIVRIGGPIHNVIKDGIATGHFKPVDPQAAIWLILSLLDSMYLLIPALMGLPGALEDPRLEFATRQFIVRGLGAGEVEVRP